jgi:hemoglobin
MNAPINIAVQTNPHLERLGGMASVTRLVDAFYSAMDTRGDAKTIRAMHASDLAATKAVLVRYFTEWLGGPKLYSADRGPARLRRVHQPFPIDHAASQAWLGCMQQALEEIGAEPALRSELAAAFAKLAAHIENTEVTHHHRSP